MIESYTIIGGVAVESAGAGTGAVTTTLPSAIVGRVIGVGVVYQATPPATTDVTVRTANKNGTLPDVTILSVANANTDIFVQGPFVLGDDVNGADITGVYANLVIADQVEVVVGGANAGDSVDVTLVVER
jgi:hypothetical protein